MPPAAAWMNAAFDLVRGLQRVEVAADRFERRGSAATSGFSGAPGRPPKATTVSSTGRVRVLRRHQPLPELIEAERGLVGLVAPVGEDDDVARDVRAGGVAGRLVRGEDRVVQARPGHLRGELPDRPRHGRAALAVAASSARSTGS